MNHLRRLVAHMTWADRLTFDALTRAPGIEPRVIDLYAHLLAAEHVWLARLEGRPAALAVWPSLALDACERLAAENALVFTRYVDDLGSEDLDRTISYKNSAGAEFTSRIEDIVMHVALHGAYHRGQITSAIRAGGVIPNPTDYIAFTRGAPAATRIDPR